MKKDRKDESFVKKPFYEGGPKKMKEFINKNLVYPEISSRMGIEGDVHLRFEIDKNGRVGAVKIIKGLDEACNEEATRVVKLLQFTVPKNPRKLKIVFHKKIVINFRLRTSTQSPAQTQPSEGLQFNYVTTKTSEKPEETGKKDTGGSYNYTISF